MPQGRGEGAQAEREEKGDKGVKEGDGQDVEDEIEREVGVPRGLVGGGGRRGHGFRGSTCAVWGKEQKCARRF